MNLNIEGTKHEKAVLVVLSYVVGFTTGFIVFGLTQPRPLQSVSTQAEMETTVPEDIFVEPALEEISETPVEAAAELPNTGEQVMYKDGQLIANVNGASVLLSAQMKTVDAETAVLFANQGVHEVIPYFQASPDGAFIYYCEQHVASDTCINFVYSVNEKVIQYVTVDDIKLDLAPEAAKTAYWSGSTLHLGGAMSTNVAAPWKLSTVQ